MEFFGESSHDGGDQEPEILTEYYDDPYQHSRQEDGDYDYEDILNSNMYSPFSFNDILEHCIEPTLKDGLKHIGKLIVWCVIFRILSQSGKKYHSFPAIFASFYAFFIRQIAESRYFGLVRLFSASKIPSWLVHSMSAVIGVIVLGHFFYINVQYQLGLTFLSWLALNLGHKCLPGSRGLVSAFVCVSFNMIW
jgi:hypothetical protein